MFTIKSTKNQFLILFCNLKYCVYKCDVFYLSIPISCYFILQHFRLRFTQNMTHFYRLN